MGEAKQVAYEMLLSLAYLHKHNLVHCDIKLENWLYDNDTADSNLKLIDFGFSKVWDGVTAMHTSQGSPSYVAPEVLNGHYGNKCDLWSFGVVVFMLLAGYPALPMK